MEQDQEKELTPAEQFRKLIQADIDSLTRKRDLDWTWIPDLPRILGVKNASWGMTVLSYPHLSMPFDRVLMEKVRAKMLELGFEIDYETSEADQAKEQWQDYTQTWVNKHSQTIPFWRIVIAYDDRKEGSVCRRREIGKVTVEQPIYEYACSEMSQ